MTDFARITSDPAILGGKPCIRGARLSVEFILDLIASGAARGDVVKAYPQSTTDDVEQAVRYAAEFLRNEVIILTKVAG